MLMTPLMGKGKGMAPCPANPPPQPPPPPPQVNPLGLPSSPLTLLESPIRSQVTVEGDLVSLASGSCVHDGSGLVEQVRGASTLDDHSMIQPAGTSPAEQIETSENPHTIPTKGTPSAQLGEDEQQHEYIKQALTDPALAQLQADHSNSMIDADHISLEQQLEALYAINPDITCTCMNELYNKAVMKLQKMPAAPGLVEDGPKFVKATLILMKSLLHIYRSTRRKAYKEDPHQSSTPMLTVTINPLDSSFHWDEQ
ncbi:hypothetical protein BDQ17DRAFT_1439005 [Cyathus striatus]|nr:hypothetical protein BDQ17DRAFT_1439005 [Cyathus striatus]